MVVLASLLSWTLLAMILGKVARTKGVGWYIVIAIVTILQVAIVSYQLFIMESPLS